MGLFLDQLDFFEAARDKEKEEHFLVIVLVSLYWNGKLLPAGFITS